MRSNRVVNGAASLAARDGALDSVTKNNRAWIDEAIDYLPAYPLVESDEATGEALNLWLVRMIGEPRDEHAYGGMINRAVRLGILTDTGRIERMRVVTSHGRRTPVWRINDPPIPPPARPRKCRA